VQKYGMVVISRAGSNPEKFIYDSDVLTRHKVFCLLFYMSCHFWQITCIIFVHFVQSDVSHLAFNGNKSL